MCMFPYKLLGRSHGGARVMATSNNELRITIIFSSGVRTSERGARVSSHPNFTPTLDHDHRQLPRPAGDAATYTAMLGYLQ